MIEAEILALRVDVDFPVGLTRGVPRMLEALRAAGMRATFFVVAGSNRPATRQKLTSAAWLGRQWRLGPLRTASRLLVPGLRLGPGFVESAAARAVLRRILDEGHELAAHGHDHAWWVEHGWSAPENAVGAEIDRARAVLEAASGERATAWGSPSWRTSDAVLHALERCRVPYLAECWGREPFVSLDGRGAEIRLVHLPITLPSLESRRLGGGPRAEGALDDVGAALRPGAFAMACVHDYFEGLLWPELFPALLARFAAAGRSAIPLREAAERFAPVLDRLPRSPLVRRPLPGFVGDVSWQGTAC